MKLLLAFLLFAEIGFAETKHRHHEAHKHGSGTLGIAFDKEQGKADFKIPGESIIGFEYVAKSEKDKEKQRKQLDTLENKISEMIVFESSLKCLFTKEKVDVLRDADGDHSDVQASFQIKCDKSPVGTTVTFNFQKFFPKISDLDVQILTETVQKSVEAKKNGTTVKL